jgi:hypothetical protein
MTVTPPQPPAGRSAGRIIAITAATLLGALAVTFVALGGGLVGLHALKRNGDGFYATGQKTLKTPTYALVADKLDANGPSWLFGKNRLGTIRVAANGTPAKPIFIGVARTAQVDTYLRGVAQDEIGDFDIDPFSVSYDRHPGTAAPAAPAGQSLWAARATGSGRQTLTWRVREGNWAVVVMNADGSQGVQTDVSVGAKAGVLVWVGAGLLALGALFAAWAAILSIGLRRRPRAIAGGTRVAQPAMQ